GVRVPDPLRHRRVDDRRLVLAPARVPRGRGLRGIARDTAPDDRGIAASRRPRGRRAAADAAGLRHYRGQSLPRAFREPSADRGAHRRSGGAASAVSGPMPIAPVVATTVLAHAAFNGTRPTISI